MHPFYADWLNNLQELHRDIEKALDGLPQAALDWSPKPGVNPITILVVHLTGAERFWIGEVVGNDPAKRDREAEFRAQGLTVETLRQRLSDSRVYLAGVLDGLAFDELEAKRTARGREVTVGWALGHVLKHTATHLGHIQVMRDLWEQFGA